MGNDRKMYLISIISPFYNSEKKCKRLLDTLLQIDDKDVELIFVDDGSTDNTLDILQQFKNESNLSTHVISQENKGPGGARNTGIRVATGKYVWFVDSDDNIHLEAIDFLRQNTFKNYDFIDFDHDSAHGRVNSMNLPLGEYTDAEKVRHILLENFGRIWTKCIRRELIFENNIFYPEYCIYEDNSLGFVYPFVIKSFYKSDIIGYVHHEEHESVTRSESSPRYFDRMNTAFLGLKNGLLHANDDEQIILYQKFVRLYLVNTVARFMTRLPSKEWLTACRVMRQFRYVVKENDIENLKPDIGFISENLKFRTLFRMLWTLSYLLPDQNVYFNTLRMQAWGKVFEAEGII